MKPDVYIGADGHIYIRFFGYLLWRSSERVPQGIIDMELANNKGRTRCV